MQRWEYRVVSLQKGRYTEALNEYGQEGWELVSVASDVRGVTPTEPSRGSSSSSGMPMPRSFGRLEDAAAMVNKLGGSAAEAEAPEPTASTTLLWVLRRPLNDDY
jgi:Domain of unknown function (DUF4177)